MPDGPFYAVGILAALLTFAAVAGALAGSTAAWAILYAPAVALTVGLVRDFTQPPS